MTGCIYKIENVGFAVIGFVSQPYRTGFDCDASFTLKIHIVQYLFFHFSVCDRFGLFEYPVRQSGLSVIYVRNDTEVAYLLHIVFICQAKNPFFCKKSVYP